MKILNVGLVGIGRIARVQMDELVTLPQYFKLMAIADHEPQRLEKSFLPENARELLKYPSLEAMLENPQLDMICICTRHPEHVPMALQIMAAGKIAVVEKPVATSLEEMEALREAAQRHPGKLYFRHNRRFESPFKKVRQLLNTGIIGEVQYIKLYRSVGYCRRNDWMTMTQFYGGLLTNWGPHLIDQALQLLGAPVVDLWADVRNVISIGDGDDLFKILLKAENGRVADIEVTGANTMPGREMEIIGNRGTIIFNGGNEKIHVRYIDPAVELKQLQPHPENPPLQYGNFDETLYFVEADYDLPQADSGEYWRKLYQDNQMGIPFEVTFDDAYQVVKTTQMVFQKSGFQPIQKFKSKL